MGDAEPLAHGDGVQRLNLPARAKGHGDELRGAPSKATRRLAGGPRA
ncbi:hypothetical protein GGD63_000154 [Bradyrhizobium sp. cir1]|nr:hypothetical protein [Bradyrhizobium sp. cir1]